MSVKKFYDAIIIGGGASGLMCAVSAMHNNKNLKLAIIEKNDRVGKKLLSTGNGRCNLTNKCIDIEKYTGSFKNKLPVIFNRFTTDYLLDIFNKIGLITYADNEGRYYPISKQASSVLDVLRFSCERLGVDIYCNQNIRKISKTGNKFSLITDCYDFISDKAVLSCGSKASPKLGGNASIADYVKNFGHNFIPFSPALCPVKVQSDLLKSLKGIRVSGVAALVDNMNNIIKAEKGEIQFTDKSLSGICIFNLSLLTKTDYKIKLDLLPNYSKKELYNLINKQKSLYKDKEIDCLFTGVFQKRVSQAILKMSGVSNFSFLCKEISEGIINNCIETIKNMSFKVTSNDDFSNAQCCVGGVNGNQINEYTMESKIVKNLYICGEAIDICGICGGYNLHFAFSSGYIAGENL